MKYDEYDKVDSVDYPNNNILIEQGKPHKAKRKLGMHKGLDIALGSVFFVMSFALVMLFTSVVTMAVSGSLAPTLLSIFG